MMTQGAEVVLFDNLPASCPAKTCCKDTFADIEKTSLFTFVFKIFRKSFMLIQIRVQLFLRLLFVNRSN